MKSIQRSIWCAVLLLGYAAAASAQSVFSLPETVGSVRGIGMGGVGGALEANAFSIYDNASKVAFSQRSVEFGVQYSPWNRQQTAGTDRDNLLLNAGGYVSLPKEHRLLAGVTCFAPGGNDMFQTDENGDRLGDERLKPAYVSASLGYAGSLSRRCGFSAVLGYANWNPGLGPKTSALSVDLAVTDRMKLRGGSYFDASLQAKGWGYVFSDYAGDRLPGLLTVNGLSHLSFGKRHVWRLAMEMGARCLDTPALVASVGTEYVFNGMLFVRGGYHYTSYENPLNGYGAVGMGVRLFDAVQVDFAYLLAGEQSPLKGTFMIGCNLLF